MSPPIELILLVPPLLFALTFHEAAHAWTALRLGDPTAKLLGRLTLNPLAHLDPIGTIVFFIARIGWAKPVPVDVRYLRHPRRDMMWIALAGPASNVVLALGFGLALRGIDALGVSPTSAGAAAGLWMMARSVELNLALAAFNLIPIHPLDGSKILAGLLRPTAATRYQALEPIGPMLLLGLILLGSISGVSVIGAWVWPFVRHVGGFFTGGLL